MAVVILMGACFLVIGALMTATGNTFLIHGYHLTGVAPEDRPRVGRGVGLATAVCGVGVVLLGIAPHLGQMQLTDPLVMTGLAVVVAGVLLGCGTIAYYQVILPTRRGQ